MNFKIKLQEIKSLINNGKDDDAFFYAKQLKKTINLPR